jgi:5-methylcytosine-specific restriction endonuclease McrA
VRLRLSFDEFPYVLSLYRVYMREESPGADMHTGRNLIETYASVVDQIIKDGLATNGIPYTPDWVANIWLSMRKSGPEGYRLKCEVALNSGGICRCYYAGRDVGECSQDVSLDRIIPQTRGGLYTVANCQIACGRHNSSRGDQLIEDYLCDTWKQNRLLATSVADELNASIPY